MPASNTSRLEHTFKHVGANTHVAMRATDKERIHSLISMVQGDRQDALIMDARTAAHTRGATPVQIQVNVMAFDGEAYPIAETRGFVRQNINGFPAGFVSREVWRTMSGDERAAMWARIEAKRA